MPRTEYGSSIPAKFDLLSGVIGASIVALMVVCAAAAQTSPTSPSDHHARSMGESMPAALDISTAHSFSELMDNADARMHYGMGMALRNGNPDHDFASSMIPHHQGAVDMAKIELLYGRDPLLRRIAQEIIVTQQQEIAVMQRQIDSMQPATH